MVFSSQEKTSTIGKLRCLKINYIPTVNSRTEQTFEILQR
jgi:hypothetical protein